MQHFFILWYLFSCHYEDTFIFVEVPASTDTGTGSSRDTGFFIYPQKDTGVVDTGADTGNNNYFVVPDIQVCNYAYVGTPGQIEIAITGGTENYFYGIVGPLSYPNDAIWSGEDCYLGYGSLSFCHPIASSGATFTHVAAVENIVEGVTTLVSYEMFPHLTYILMGESSGHCWVWGENPDYYELFTGGVTCTLLLSNFLPNCYDDNGINLHTSSINYPDPLITDAYAECANSTYHFEVQTVNWAYGSIVHIFDTSYDPALDETHNLHPIVFEPNGLWDIWGISLEDSVSLNSYVPELNTVFGCYNIDALTFAIEVKNELGQITDCVVFGHDPVAIIDGSWPNGAVSPLNTVIGYQYANCRNINAVN